MTQVKQETNVYLADFQARFTGDDGLLAPIRRAALDRFLELGFPTLRQEDWRFTNVAPIARTPFRLAAPDGTPASLRAVEDLIPIGENPRLVFVNGHFAARLSCTDGLPGNVTFTSLAEAIRGDASALEPHLAQHARFDEHPFSALNTAFIQDGAFLHVPDGVVLTSPVQVLFISTVPAGGEPTVSYPRNLLVLGTNSQATVIEAYAGDGEGVYFTNAVSELVCGDNAVLDHYKVIREAPQAYHVGVTDLSQGRDTTTSSHTISIGGALVRNNITIVLGGPGGHGALNGLYLVGGREHVDNHLRVEHVAPRCDSREFFKGVLNDHGRAVFSGRIIVHKDAQKTDAKQTNMNLLLSQDAHVDTKPQLEIFADYVKCTHGATIGQIDREAIFYLRSRGLNDAAARGLLIYAFANEIVSRMKLVPLREQLERLLPGLHQS